SAVSCAPRHLSASKVAQYEYQAETIPRFLLVVRSNWLIQLGNTVSDGCIADHPKSDEYYSDPRFAVYDVQYDPVFSSGDSAKDILRKEVETLKTKTHRKKAYFYLWDEVMQLVCFIMHMELLRNRYMRMLRRPVGTLSKQCYHFQSSLMMKFVVIPIKELVKICREENVEQIFVDGAHAIGCVDVDMKEIGVDFYTSNLHKWLFCPPSVTFLYCRKGSRAELHHPVVSSEYGNGLAIESGWIGNRDYSSQHVVPSVLEFVNRFEGGIGGIKKRNHDAVVEMGEMLAMAWGTHLGSPRICVRVWLWLGCLLAWGFGMRMML
ncbi:hypothetical protein MKW98_003433, partial [Papaver atlanticum]